MMMMMKWELERANLGALAIRERRGWGRVRALGRRGASSGFDHVQIQRERERERGEINK